MRVRVCQNPTACVGNLQGNAPTQRGVIIYSDTPSCLQFVGDTVLLHDKMSIKKCHSEIPFYVCKTGENCL